MYEIPALLYIAGAVFACFTHTNEARREAARDIGWSLLKVDIVAALCLGVWPLLIVYGLYSLRKK